MKKEKRTYSPEFKVRLLREHFENQIPAGKICEDNNLHPNVFYMWKKELFSGALKTFSKESTKGSDLEKMARMEQKLNERNSLISEIVEDNLRLKKKLSGEI